MFRGWLEVLILLKHVYYEVDYTKVSIIDVRRTCLKSGSGREESKHTCWAEGSLANSRRHCRVYTNTVCTCQCLAKMPFRRSRKNWETASQISTSIRWKSRFYELAKNSPAGYVERGTGKETPKKWRSSERRTQSPTWIRTPSETMDWTKPTKPRCKCTV